MTQSFPSLPGRAKAGYDAGMKRRLLQWCCAVMMLASTSSVGLAQNNQEERVVVDGRLEGFVDAAQKPVNVTLEGGGTGGTWFVFGILAVICLAGLFKDAKRTHLD